MNKRMTSSILLIFTVTVVMVAFIGNYKNYVAESISIGSLLRIAAGKNYFSSLTEFPLHISSFSPLLFWILTPFAKLVGTENITLMTVVARSFIIALSALGFYSVWCFNKKIFHHTIEKRFFLVVFSWVASFFLFNFIAVRPDVPSFLFELLGFFTFIRYRFYGQGKAVHLVLAAFFLGMAAVVKLNTLGAAAGIGLFLLSGKNSKSFSCCQERFL